MICFLFQTILSHYIIYSVASQFLLNDSKLNDQSLQLGVSSPISQANKFYYISLPYSISQAATWFYSQSLLNIAEQLQNLGQGLVAQQPPLLMVPSSIMNSTDAFTLLVSLLSIYYVMTSRQLALYKYRQNETQSSKTNENYH